MFKNQKLIVLGILLIQVETVAILLFALLSFNEILIWILLASMVPTTALFFIPMFPLNPVFTPDVSSFGIKGPYLSRTVEYSDIVSLRYDGVEIGLRLMGMYMGRGSFGGTFRNKEFGSYGIVGKDRGPGTRYIILKLKDGKVIAFNLKTEEDTLLIFEQIRRYTGLYDSAEPKPYESTIRNLETRELYGKAKKTSRTAMILSVVIGIVIPLAIMILYMGDVILSIFVPTIVAVLVPLAALVAYYGWFRKTGLPKADRTGTLTVLGSQLAIVPVLFVVAGVVMIPAVIDVDMSEDYFAVSSTMLDVKIYYEDINELEITEEKFRRDWGYGGSNIGTGKFSNPNFGKVDYAAYNSVSIKIVVKHEHGIFVFNQDSEEATLAMLDLLMDKAGL